jgi:hypothetical protein
VRVIDCCARRAATFPDDGRHESTPHANAGSDARVSRTFLICELTSTAPCVLLLLVLCAVAASVDFWPLATEHAEPSLAPSFAPSLEGEQSRGVALGAVLAFKSRATTPTKPALSILDRERG